MAYVQGFLVAVAQERLDEYRACAELGARVWREHGALAYTECVGDDLAYGEVTSFPRAVLAEPHEVVVMAWILFASKAACKAATALAMSDPRLQPMMADPPFDGRRMIFGGFETLVEA